MFDNRVEKCANRAGEPKAGELTKEIGEDILQRVTGVVAVPEEANCQRECPLTMVSIQRCERFCVARVAALNQKQLVAILSTHVALQ